MTRAAELDVPSDVQRIVENSELPRRLKDRVYEVISDREVISDDQVRDIITAVENRYVETRVDPLDPVGTVSAQSIGEPGTQMSIPYDERVLIRQDGQTRVTEIGPLVDDLLGRSETRKFADHEVALAPEGLEALSLGRDEKIRWKPIDEISRHKTPDELLEMTLESGRSIRATASHSFVTRRDNEVVSVAGGELDVGDWLPVVGRFDITTAQEFVNIKDYLPNDEYWYTSVLADGGVAAELPGGIDQIRNKRTALDQGRIETKTAYPVNGTVGLPEMFPLDEETGFFFGAWLAEGNATEYYVSISNVNEEFRRKIRSFADRFSLSTNGYENHSGFSTGFDVRVNGKIVADFIRSTCLENGQKIVPEFAFGASDAFVSGLLAGYFSGDGNIGTNSIRASSTSHRLTVGVALLLARVDTYARLAELKGSLTLRIPKKFVPRFAESVGLIGERRAALEALVETVDPEGPDTTDQIPNFGDALRSAVEKAGLPTRDINSAANRQRIGRVRLIRLIEEIEGISDDPPAELDILSRAVAGDVIWERIVSIESVSSDYDHVYDFSVEGLETFTTAQGVVTHNTMNTFHYAGVAEIDVTQGLPRLIELVDARKEPDTPMMTVYLADEYASDREMAHEVVWNIEATRILALGDVSTNVADMRVRIDLNEQTLEERMITPEEIADTIEGRLDVSAVQDGPVIEFGPEQPSYRKLLQLVEELRDIVFKGIEEVSRVVVRKEESEDDDSEFVLYTEGSAFGDVLAIEGVDASRTTTNNIHEIYRNLGVEAARESIIDETMETLREQGLDDVNVRHLMLVSDIMTNRGTIESIGRHGIAGSKESVLARAAYEVTVNHLLDAAIHGEIDDLNGVIENVIVGKPIKLGTGDVDLRMGSVRSSD